MKHTRPLTPALRRIIDEGVERQLVELNECQNTPYVAALRMGLKAASSIIHSLPDGYPIPMEKKESE